MVGAEPGLSLLRASAVLPKMLGDHIVWAESSFDFLLPPQSKIEPNSYRQGFLLPPSYKSPSQRRQHFHRV